MLGIMRKYKDSIVIKLVFGIIVLSFIGTIFLVWGRGEKGMTPSSYAIKVNNSKIPYEQFVQSYNRMRSIYQQIYGANFTPDMEKQLKLKDTVIDSLTKQALARQAAKDMGIKVSKDEIVAAVSAEPAFQKDGVFNFDVYQQVLRQNRITPNDFEESKKEELLVQKATKAIKDKVQVTDEQALQEYKKQNDKLNLEYLAFTPASVRSEVKLTEADINDYYQKRANEFRTPEKVSVSYAVVDPARFAGQATVTDEEIQKFYQKNIDRYQDKGAIQPLEQVKEKVREEARKDKVLKLAYEKAAEAVNKNVKGGDLKAAASALGATIATTPIFTAAAPPAVFAGDAELVRRAMQLKENEIGGPVETKKGIYILKIAERKAAEVPPLSQIKAQVVAKLTDEKARELAKKKGEDAIAALAKGPAAGGQETGLFGFSAQGTIPKVGASPEAVEAAFTLTTAAPAAKKAFKIGEGWFAFRLKNRSEASAENFQKTKEQVRQTLLPKKQEEAVEKWLTDLKAKAKIEINPGLRDPQ